MGRGPAPQTLSNVGPQQAPGEPRPGAQSDLARLGNIGLVGPGG